ncbi:hypothetical protein [Dinoroseobacter sp. S124A]|uniref:hypothetical protein n=1 Tax=Dinoroseobacter sp. S124A TaxID=3415128 RepID=UPI003C7E1E45
MSLTLTALRWMIALAIFALAVRVFAASFREATAAQVTISTANVAILWGFLVALKRPVKWVAYVALPLSILDVFRAMSGGFVPKNALNMVDAIFSFVAACGLVIWMGEQRKVSVR